MPRFLAEIERSKPGVDAAFIRIPFDVVEVFGKVRVKVSATFDGFPYRGTLAIMDRSIGPILGIRKDIRKRIGKHFGDVIEVTLEEDTQPRTVTVPDSFKKRLSEAGLWDAFSQLAYTHRKEFVGWIESAKKDATRLSRMEKALNMIRDGKTYS